MKIFWTVVIAIPFILWSLFSYKMFKETDKDEKYSLIGISFLYLMITFCLYLFIWG